MTGTAPRRRSTGTDILWQPSLGPTTVPERVAAARAGGFAGISLSPDDCAPDRCGAKSPEEAASRARDQGVEPLTVDSIIEWYPHDPPRRMMGSAQFEVDAVLAACDRFGVGSLSALAPYPTPAGVSDLAECFAHLCDRAADHGLLVHLEFTPFPPVPDLATAWEVVGLAGRPNGGIVLDTWHFFQGRPDLELLATIPGERIMAVQVNDGREGFEESLLKDTFRHRLLPGEGTFDLTGLFRVLDRTGGLNRVGPEVLSEELFALDPSDAARRLGDASRRVFDRLPPDSAERYTG